MTIQWNIVKFHDNSMKHYEVSLQFNEILWSFLTIKWNIMKCHEVAYQFMTDDDISWQFTINYHSWSWIFKKNLFNNGFIGWLLKRFHEVFLTPFSKVLLSWLMKMVMALLSEVNGNQSFNWSWRRWSILILTSL